METAVTETTTPQTETPPPAAAAERPDYRAWAAEQDAADRAAVRPSTDAKPAVETKPAPAAKPADDDDAPAVDATGNQIRDAKGQFVSRRRQREQDEQNERIRRAVDAGIATEREKREAAERRIAELEARSGAAKSAEPQPKADDGPPEPDFERDFEALVGTKYESYGKAVQAFNRAYHQWTQDTAAHAAKREADARAQADGAKAAETRLQTFYAREDAFAAKHPTYDEQTRELRAQLHPGSPLTQALLDSEQGPALLLHFAEHPDEAKRIGALGQTNLPAALRELGKVEAKLESAAASAPAIPTRKTTSDAPPPPTTLGTRSAEPADAKEAALKRKDYSAYRTEADREDRALMAGRR